MSSAWDKEICSIRVEGHGRARLRSSLLLGTLMSRPFELGDPPEPPRCVLAKVGCEGASRVRVVWESYVPKQQVGKGVVGWPGWDR